MTPDLIASLPGDKCLVAIAGTDLKKSSSIGCSLDLRLSTVIEVDIPGSGGKNMLLHRGFRDCFRRMRDPLRVKVLQEVAKGAKHVVLAGYSLGMSAGSWLFPLISGAAMAFLCGVWLRSILPHEVSIEIKGYGTPRIGNAAWADHVDSMVCHDRDPAHPPATQLTLRTDSQRGGSSITKTSYAGSRRNRWATAIRRTRSSSRKTARNTRSAGNKTAGWVCVPGCFTDIRTARVDSILAEDGSKFCTG